jgi:hypothetical protein
MNRIGFPKLPGAAVILSLLLTGCGTSPPVRYFSLEPLHEATEPAAEEQPVIGLGQLRTPNFVFRSQMVTRSRGGELIVHDFLRWSEPLDQAIHRVVAANVDGLLSGVSVIPFPYWSVLNPVYRVYGSVERFDVDDAGNGVLVVQWGIISADGAVVAEPRRSRYESRASAADDPTSVVQALNTVLADFSRDIAEHLDSLP